MSSRSVFDKLNENSCTQLLCNFMTRSSDVRSLVLKQFLDPEVASAIPSSALQTQRAYPACGRPDMEILTSDIRIFFEVKWNRLRPCTENQKKAYFRFLNECQEGEKRWLIYLVPRNWAFRKETEEFLESNKTRYRCVVPKILYWEDILQALEQLTKLDPVLQQFHLLLEDQLRGAKFMSEDINMLFNQNGFPNAFFYFQALIENVTKKIRGIKKLAEDEYGFTCNPTLPGDPEEIGMYFKTEKKVSVLFFGVWIGVWEKEGFPLCFVVPKRACAYYPDLEHTFSALCKGRLIIKDFEEDWIVGRFSQESLSTDAVEAAEAVSREVSRILEGIYLATCHKAA